jgi:hypothetical protein
MRAVFLMGVVAGEQFPAAFPVEVEEAVPVVMEEDSMVVGVVKGKPLQCYQGASPVFGCIVCE